MQVEDHLIPPSGVVVKCPTCTAPNTLYPPESEELDLDSVLGGEASAPAGGRTEMGLGLPREPAGGGAAGSAPAWGSDLGPLSLDDDGIDLPGPRASTQEPDLLAPVSGGRRPPGGFGAGHDDGGLDLPGLMDDSSVDLPAPVQTQGAWDDGLDLPAPALQLDDPAPPDPPMAPPLQLDDPEPAPPQEEAPHLSLDDLDLGPVPEPAGPSADELDLDEPLDLPPAGGGFQLDEPVGHGAGPVDSFDLGPADDGGAPLDSLQLDESLQDGGFNLDPPPGAPPPDAGGDAFSMDNLDLTGGGPPGPASGQGGPAGYAAPDDDAFAVPADAGPLDIDGELPQNRGSLADDLITDDAAAHKKRRRKVDPEVARKRKILLSVAAALLIVGGGGAYAYSTWSAEKERAALVAQGLDRTRALMVSDAQGHWDQAIEEGKSVVRVDDKNADVLGLQAQAHLAAALASGVGEKERVDQADAIINKALRVGGQGAELAKAQALRKLMDDKAADAVLALEQVSSPGDPNLPLYLGWAALENGEPVKALTAFTKAEQMATGRLEALFGKGRAEVEIGGDSAEAARQTFGKVLEKDSSHLGARVGLVELMPRDREGTKEKRLEEILKSEEAREGNKRELSRAWSLYGDEALAAGRVDAAYERYTTALKEDARNLAAQVGIGLTALEKNKLPEARFRLEGVLASDKENTRAHVALTRLALLEGKMEEARASIQKAMEAQSADADVQLWMGNVLVAEKGDPAAAEAAFRKAIELDANHYGAYVALSSLLRSQGRTDEALDVLGPVEKAAMDDPFLATSLGTAYLNSGSPDRGESWFRAALEDDPDNVDAQASLGAALEAQGQLDEALSEYDTALRKSGGAREDIALRYAEALERAKKVGEAQKIFAQLLEPRTDGTTASLAVRAAAGRFFARQEQLERAVSLGLAILADDPQNPAGLFLRGLGEKLDGDLVAASRSMADAVALDPQPQYYNGLGEVFEQQNAVEDALNAYEQAIKRDPAYVKPRLGRARIRIVRREFSAALPELLEAAKLQPDNAEVQWLIGESLFELGVTASERRKAAVHYRQATLADPDRYRAYFKLGQIHFDDDQPSEAAAAFRRYLDKAPASADRRADANYYLGYALRARRDKAGACRAFREFLDLAERNDPKRGDIRREILSCP